MDAPATLGEYLKAARMQAGLSQRQLAARVGIDHSFLARVESGEYQRPMPDVLQRLADVLEIPSTDLLGFIGVKPAEGLPELAPYLRAKYRLNDEQIRKATVYFRRARLPIPDDLEALEAKIEEQTDRNIDTKTKGKSR